jgi:hypothetical protein
LPNRSGRGLDIRRKLVENCVSIEVWLPLISLSFENGRMTAFSDVLEMDLSGAVQVGEGIYRYE